MKTLKAICLVITMAFVSNNAIQAQDIANNGKELNAIKKVVENYKT